MKWDWARKIRVYHCENPNDCPHSVEVPHYGIEWEYYCEDMNCPMLQYSRIRFPDMDIRRHRGHRVKK